MIILKNGKFISGNRIFRAGDSLPDTEITRLLVEQGRAEIIETNTRKNKSAKKIEPDKANVTQNNIAQENVKVDT